MNTMTLSPIQHDYVTKKEFREFRTDTNIRFDNVEHSIKELKSFTIEGFEKIEEYIDKSNEEVTTKLIVHMDQLKADMIDQINLKNHE